MRIRRLFFWAFLLGLLLCVTGLGGDPKKVRHVYDGDTICLENGWKVRYIGIDTPEIDPETHEGEYLAHKARAFNKDLLEGGSIRLERDIIGKDRYGRALAYIFLKDGRMMNALMVEKGLAHVMTHPPNTKYRARLLNCQRRAMQRGVGIWRRLPKNQGTRYTGNQNSYRFHTNNCRFGKQISTSNRVEFNSLHEAFWAGYSPCNVCRPAADLKE